MRELIWDSHDEFYGSAVPIYKRDSVGQSINVRSRMKKKNSEYDLIDLTYI